MMLNHNQKVPFTYIHLSCEIASTHYYMKMMYGRCTSDIEHLQYECLTS